MKALKFYNKILLWMLLLCSYSLWSQEFSLGIKGGVNSSINKRAAEIVGSQGRFSTNSRPGFQAGVFLELEFNEFFLRPEAFFSRAQGEFPLPEKPLTYTTDKISLPILFGRNIYKGLDLYAGPAYQYFLNTELEDASIMGSSEPPENQQINLAAQIGMKYVFRRFEIDLRFDFTFDSKNNQRIDIAGGMQGAGFDDGRLNQFMLSLSYKLFDPKLPNISNLRGGSCYF